MENIKKYLVSISITFAFVIIFSFIVNLFNYFDLLSNNLYKVSMTILVGISIAIGAFMLGKKTDKKGYLEGLKFGIIVIILFISIAFLAFDKTFSISSFIYYLILLIISSLSSVFGINRKEKDIG